MSAAPAKSRPIDDGAPSAADVRRLKTLNMIFELRAFIALAVLIVVFSMLSDSFLNVANLITMTKHVAINAVLALGMLLVILKGGIDLSVGSIVGLSGVVCGDSSVVSGSPAPTPSPIQRCGWCCSARWSWAPWSGSSTAS